MNPEEYWRKIQQHTIRATIARQRMDLEKEETDKFLYEMKAITNLDKNEILERLKPLKSKNSSIKEFILATGRFPTEIEDKFIFDFGIESWYDMLKSGLIKNKLK